MNYKLRLKLNKGITRKLLDTGIVLLMIVLMIFLASFTLAMLYNEKINDGSSQITSDQQLICYWTLDITANANVSWYRNGVLNITNNNIACIASQPCSTGGDGNVPASSTFRDDVWLCSVAYYNGTSLEIQNVSATIINSPPTPSKILFLNGTDTTNITAFIPEDNSTIFNVSSTDADNDAILYTINDTTYCSIGASSGMLTCTPTLESHIGIKKIKIGAQDGSSAQFVTLTLNVTPTNDAPYFSPALQNKTVLEGQSFNYLITGTDDESNLPYNFSITSDLSSLVIVQNTSNTANIMLNHSGSSIAWFSDRGNHTVYATIGDNDNITFNSRNFTASFILQVIPQNHLPTIAYNITSGSLVQGGSLLVYVNSTDIDNDTLTFYTNNTALYNITYTATDHSNPNGTSKADGVINVSLLTNDHVISRYVRITVFDGKENNSVNVFLNITNVNDMPIIYNYSNYAGNTLNNIDINNLTSYTGVSFRYAVNGTDPDLLTYQGDALSYSTNDSRFYIDAGTGMLDFTPNTSGNYTFTVTVADASSASFNKSATLHVLVNTNPYFTQSPIIIYCNEYDAGNYPYNCYYNFSANASDSDAGDYVANYWINETLNSTLSINSVTGVMDFNATQSQIGNHPIMLNITDTRGGMNSTLIALIINNTNNAPGFTQISTPSGNMIVGRSYQIGVYANDTDLLLGTYENLTFNITVNPATALFVLSKTSSDTAVIAFNPSSSSDAGNYSMNITVQDYYGNYTVQSIHIFIYNQTSIPDISMITPFGTPYTDTINTSWRNFTDFNQSTSIAIDENSTYIFNQSSAPDLTYANSLNYSWYYDGVLAGSSNAYSKYFGFFSNGVHNITFIASDQYYSNNSFTWLITVNNVNRPPVLVSQLDNLVVNGTTTYNNYMTYYNSNTRFIDYDDDVDGNNRTISSETTLIFSAESCDYAAFSFTYGDLKVTPTGVGVCYVYFNATDALNNSMMVSSNIVTINITSVSNDSSESEPQPVIVTGGGGGSSRTVMVPVPEDVEKPKPLQIITPKLVTVYRNATIQVPIVLNNTWSGVLEGISLNAFTNATNVTLYIDKIYFPRLYTNKTEEVTLTIINYKTEGHYEIQVRANVTNPPYQDIATIYINSADISSAGQEVDTKIAFAKDLLSSNPECQELNEVLNQAKQEISKNNFLGATKLVDNVINGCKYLVSQKKSNTESPSKDFIKSFEWQRSYNQYLIFGAFGIIMVAALYYLFKKDNPEDF